MQSFIESAIIPEGSLDDLTGLESAKEELWSAFIMQKELNALWTPLMQLQCGILLHGPPPGCGKTTFAIKSAAKAQIKIIKASTCEVSSTYCGGASLKMSALFDDHQFDQGKALHLLHGVSPRSVGTSRAPPGRRSGPLGSRANAARARKHTQVACQLGQWTWATFRWCSLSRKPPRQ